MIVYIIIWWLYVIVIVNWRENLKTKHVWRFLCNINYYTKHNTVQYGNVVRCIVVGWGGDTYCILTYASLIPMRDTSKPECVSRVAPAIFSSVLLSVWQPTRRKTHDGDLKITICDKGLRMIILLYNIDKSWVSHDNK